MNSDEKLDRLLDSARQERAEIPIDFGFETRLLASIREARSPQTLFGLLAWRMLPAFAAITLLAAVYNEKNSPQTDLTGSFLGETALAEILTN